MIQDKTRTPFNVGRAIELQGFRLHEVQPLAQGLEGKVDNPQEVLREILVWTGGQPFLTQKLCHLVLSVGEEPPLLRGEQEWIEQMVTSRIIENWESTDEPEHLRTIRDRILRDQQRAGRRLGLYQQILQQGEIAADDSYNQIELRLSGLVVEQQGKLRVYNRIYGAVFNQDWVERALADLRPYAALISAWLASNCNDESRLLRGQALRDAQAWAVGKSLGDKDYQFLARSQEFEQREVQVALEAERQAKQILAEAQRKAELALEEERKANQGLAEAQQKTKQQMSLGGVAMVIMLAIAAIAGVFAQNSIQIAQEGTRLERDGTSALRQLESVGSGYGEIDALLTAMQAGQGLKKQIKDNTPLKDYPAFSPIFALQQILFGIREQNQLKGHLGSVNSVSFSRDGQTIATASSDNTARLWSRNGQLLSELKGHLGSVYSLSFSPDGQTIATASSDKTARLWPVRDLPGWLAQGCDWLSNYLVTHPTNLATLEVCQTASNRLAAVPFLVKEGEEQARAGNLETAITTFQTALKWNPNLNFDPETKAKNLADPASITEQKPNKAQKAKNEKKMTKYLLPTNSKVYVGPDNSVTNHPAPGYVEKTLPTVNKYTGDDGGYIAVYSRDPKGSVYSIGNGIYVVGQIRLQGYYQGRIFQPRGHENQDISASQDLKNLTNEIFPGREGGTWAGGDTGGWFDLQ